MSVSRERLQPEHHESNDMGQIQLPHTSIYLSHREDLALAAHSPSIDDGRSVTRNENEDLGSICECDRLEGEVRENVVLNMVYVYEKQRKAAEEIEPQIAFCLLAGITQWNRHRFGSQRRQLSSMH
jgi:hypothetical protein